jgi:hypothetical protein
MQDDRFEFMLKAPAGFSKGKRIAPASLVISGLRRQSRIW